MSFHPPNAGSGLHATKESTMRKSSIQALFALLVFFWSNAPGDARIFQVEKVPNPMETSGFYVQDSAGVLGADYIELINLVSQTLYEKASTELAVITIASLEGLPIEEFALRLFERFGIGEKGEDTGILILFARDDREIRLEVGYGLEDVVTDMAASRLLDENALPFFREGLYGQGLYNTALKIAEFVSEARGISLGIEESETLPAQVAPPEISEESIPKSEKHNSVGGLLLYTAGIFGFILFGFVVVLLRVLTKKSKAARVKAVKGQGFILTVMWLGAVFGPFILADSIGFSLPLLLTSVVSPALSTMGMLKGIKWLQRRAESYRASCPDCSRKMDLIDEKNDDAFLSVEERAEETAEGMDYEIWKCPGCDKTSRFDVKLRKAGKCPQCKRRTLKTTTTTLKAATRSSGGRIRVLKKCKNPKCGYSKVSERDTPKIPPPSSSSSGRSSFSGRSSSSRSSRSSFGGGRSGGGGSSKRW